MISVTRCHVIQTSCEESFYFPFTVDKSSILRPAPPLLLRCACAMCHSSQSIAETQHSPLLHLCVIKAAIYVEEKRQLTHYRYVYSR